MMEVMVTTGAIRVQSSSQIVTTNKPPSNILQAGCPSCRPTNSVRTLKRVWVTLIKNKNRFGDLYLLVVA